MKKILPIFLSFLFILLFLFFSKSAFAQQTVGQANVPVSTADIPANDTWILDPSVTFVGMLASRSNDFINFSLRNYQWVKPGVNPLEAVFVKIQIIAYAFLVLFVIGTAFVLIVTRGRNITAMKFVPRFILIVLLIFLSFAIVRFFYEITDVIQGFFLKTGDGTFISSKNLLDVGFNYTDFAGYSLVHDTGKYLEPRFMTLLLLKLTSITYFVMGGILLLRKVVLWFFIIISPVLPLLLFYTSIRNTVRVWLGEFFRWLLYAPIFAILLSGLVGLWSSGVGIPLNFDPIGGKKVGVKADILYPTAITILLSGPGSKPNADNSLNLPETFILYVVSLIMLWVVIILPFILLQIFLGSFQNVSLQANPLLNKIVGFGNSFVNRPPPVPSAPSYVTASPRLPKLGVAMQIPLARSIPNFQTNFNSQQRGGEYSNFISSKQVSEVSQLTNLSIPTMRDVARFETATLSQSSTDKENVARFTQSLEKIANPNLVTNSSEKEYYNSIREQLVQEKQKGNSVASAILHATEGMQTVSTTNSTTTSSAQSGPQTAITQGVQTVSTSVSQTGSNVITSMAALPKVNTVQTVSLDDYEAVKKMWQENYLQMEPPQNADETQKDRKSWIQQDSENISRAIELLSSADEQKQKEGMNMVAKILPFLLVGGFSQSEVIAYLKAKLEAGKTVLSQLDAKQNDEETMISRDETSAQGQKEMMAETVVDSSVSQSVPVTQADESHSNS